MELNSLNSITRNEIYSYIDKMIRNGKTVKESADELRDTLYESQIYDYTTEDNMIKKYRELVINTAYLDALKMTIYKHKVGLVNDEELIFFNNLTGLEDLEELYSETSADFDLLSNILVECYNYNSLNEFSKSIIMKSLTESENNFLCQTFKLHIYDTLVYCRNITIDDLINYYNKLIKHEKKYLGEALDDNNLTIVYSYIHNLNKYDRENAIDLLLELGKIDYSVCKFLSTKIDSEFILDHIDYYENYSLDDILYKLSTNQIFLSDVIYMFKALYIDKSYDDIELSIDILKTDYSRKIEKKLTIK